MAQPHEQERRRLAIWNAGAGGARTTGTRGAGSAGHWRRQRSTALPAERPAMTPWTARTWSDTQFADAEQLTVIVACGARNTQDRKALALSAVPVPAGLTPAHEGINMEGGRRARDVDVARGARGHREGAGPHQRRSQHLPTCRDNRSTDITPIIFRTSPNLPFRALEPTYAPQRRNAQHHRAMEWNLTRADHRA
jgi:hypothetical protein